MSDNVTPLKREKPTRRCPVCAEKGIPNSLGIKLYGQSGRAQLHCVTCLISGRLTRL